MVWKWLLLCKCSKSSRFLFVSVCIYYIYVALPYVLIQIHDSFPYKVKDTETRRLCGSIFMQITCLEITHTDTVNTSTEAPFFFFPAKGRALAKLRKRRCGAGRCEWPQPEDEMPPGVRVQWGRYTARRRGSCRSNVEDAAAHHFF